MNSDVTEHEDRGSIYNLYMDSALHKVSFPIRIVWSRNILGDSVSIVKKCVLHELMLHMLHAHYILSMTASEDMTLNSTR